MACGCGKKRAGARAAGEPAPAEARRANPVVRQAATQSQRGRARYLVTNGVDELGPFESLFDARAAARAMAGKVQVLSS